MSKDLSATLPRPVAAPDLQTRVDMRAIERRPQRDTAPVADGAQVAQATASRNGESERVLEKVVTRLAENVYPDRQIEVNNFVDEGSGRIVFRVADKESGQVLHQSPPDELLRFFASGRHPASRPLVYLDV